jgi:hypothetical protein
MNAELIAKKAMPCPFCGESLVVKSDHHGEWVAHDKEPGPCESSTSQLHDETDLTRWNTRYFSPATQEGAKQMADDLRHYAMLLEREGYQAWHYKLLNIAQSILRPDTFRRVP